MPLPFRRVRANCSMFLVAALAGACAHAAGPATAVRGDRVDPPTMQRGPSPEIRGEITASYEVMVDATGRADVSRVRR